MASAKESKLRGLNMVKAIRLKLNFNRQITPAERDWIRSHRDIFPARLYSDEFLERLVEGSPVPRAGKKEAKEYDVLRETIRAEKEFWDPIWDLILPGIPPRGLTPRQKRLK